MKGPILILSVLWTAAVFGQAAPKSGPEMSGMPEKSPVPSVISKQVNDVKAPAVAAEQPSSSTTAPNVGFKRYEVIIQKMPFGPGPIPPKPPAPQKVEPVVPVDPGWAKAYRLSMINTRKDGTVRVGMVRTADNMGFTLEVGDKREEDGIELVSVDPAQFAVVLRRGTDARTLKMDFSQPMASAPAPSKAAPGSLVAQRASSSTASFEQRRNELQKRLEERKHASQQASSKKRYKGAELEQHLKNYQMDLIRRGGNAPLLPIPVTSDMKKQLVKEGLLNPEDAKKP